MTFSEEPKITLAEAARWWCRDLPYTMSTVSVWRACRKGRRSASGEVVRLEHAKVGRRIVTSIEAISRFEEALTKSDLRHFKKNETGPKAPVINRRRSPGRARHGVGSAQCKLDSEGFKR